MTLKKFQLVIGIVLIVSGVMFFYIFFEIMIGFLSNPELTFMDILPGMMGMITHVLPEMWHFHIPGFALIILGIFYLIKSKK